MANGPDRRQQRGDPEPDRREETAGGEESLVFIPVTSRPEDWRPSDAEQSPERLGHHPEPESGHEPTRR